MEAFPRTLRARFPDLGLALKSILGFWALYFLTLVSQTLFLEQGAHHFGPRLVGIALGVLLTLLLYFMIRGLGGEKLRTRAAMAAIGCLPAAAIFATFNLVFFLYQPLMTEPVVARRDSAGEAAAPSDIRIVTATGAPSEAMIPAIRDVLRERAPRMIADGIVTWYFFFAAWASFYIAMSSAVQLRDAERRALLFERQAQAAQLRALRYQVNPHFLFNTLNSLSSLIMARRAEEAETMIVNLSDFFRTTLALDPTEDVTLREEIAFQMLYLDIEKARFPSRLKVVTDVPVPLERVRIPALLLQPLIENAIKYGVAKAPGEVTLSIAASALDGDRVRITVTNDGASMKDAGVDHGTGVGLPNVCERLAARFGPAASCSYGPVDGGGFKVELVLPMVTQ